MTGRHRASDLMQAILQRLLGGPKRANQVFTYIINMLVNQHKNEEKCPLSSISGLHYDEITCMLIIV